MNYNLRYHTVYCLSLTLLLVLGISPMAMAQYGLPVAPGGDQAGQPVRQGDGLRIEGCLIELVTDIRLPATETGLLTHLGVKEGANVRAEDVIAQIDDRTAQQAHRMARFGKEAADARAEDDIEIIFNKASADVARADLDELQQANEAVSKAVTQADIRRAKLDLKRAKLGTLKAMKDKELAGLDALTKLAEFEASQIGIDQRKVFAPFDGQVVEIYRHEQEWVQAGDPILRFIQLDTLKVQGYVHYDDYAPREIIGCEVTVEVRVGRGVTEQATGRVVYIDPVAVYQDKKASYTVQAEITNLQRDGRWIISPELKATMTIHLGTGGVANARR